MCQQLISMQYWSIPHPWIVPRKNDGSGRTSWFFLSRTFRWWFQHVILLLHKFQNEFDFVFIFWCCSKEQSCEEQVSELMRCRWIWCCYIDINIETCLRQNQISLRHWYQFLQKGHFIIKVTMLPEWNVKNKFAS